MPTTAHPFPLAAVPARAGTCLGPGEGELDSNGQLDALVRVRLRVWRPRFAEAHGRRRRGPAGRGRTCSKYL